MRPSEPDSKRPMKNSLLLTVAIIVFLGAGCSTPTKVDKGPIHATTFSFVLTGSKPAPFADKDAAIHAVIQQAITRNLAAKGVSKLPVGGDVTVAYLLIIGNPVATEYIDEYFGYHRSDQPGLMDKAHAAYTGRKNPNYFEAGTLVIDLIDSSGNLLWRSYATRPVLGNPTAEQRAANVQGAVDEALANLRVVP